MDELTPDQQLARDAVRAWYNGLTDRAQASLSDFDLDYLAEIVEGALSGTLRACVPSLDPPPVQPNGGEPGTDVP